MADRLNIEIGDRLAQVLLRLSEEQNRPPDEVMEEALLYYLQGLGVDSGTGIGKAIGQVHVESPEEPAPEQEMFLNLMDRMSSRFDLDEDEAMRIAVEEQKAFRSERADRERERTQR